MHHLKMLKLSSAIALAVTLAACGGGGDVNVSPTNVDNSVDNSDNSVNNPPPTDTGGSNPCASYTKDGTTRRGAFDGSNCSYNAAFVGESNPLTVDVTIPFISGVHIFQDSLFVGTNVDSGAAPAGGTGPKLTIAAGNKLAFSDSADYVLINRGSQLIANGSAAAPITFTAFSDAVTKTAAPEAVSLWGGIVINGNGITNNCTDAQRSSNSCHVLSEGKPSNYGGNDNSESSGSLRYVVTKHTGFAVVSDDELNGVTFNAVGSGTVVENLQVYSTFDDGIEFFGGAVDVTNFIALYVRDDSVDFSDGYIGTVKNALIIHSETDGNRCIEGDNIGETRAASGESVLAAPLTVPVIENMTCITSNAPLNPATHGDSEGLLLRRGAQMKFINGIVFGAYSDDAGNNNECWEIESVESQNAAIAGSTVVASTIIACDEPTRGNLANGDSLLNWTRNTSTVGASYPNNTGNVVINTAGNELNPNLRVLDGFYTASSFADLTGTAFSVTPLEGAPYIGAVRRNDDWTAGWSYGLHPENRGQPLWFE